MLAIALLLDAHGFPIQRSPLVLLSTQDPFLKSCALSEILRVLRPNLFAVSHAVFEELAFSSGVRILLECCGYDQRAPQGQHALHDLEGMLNMAANLFLGRSQGESDRENLKTACWNLIHRMEERSTPLFVALDFVQRLLRSLKELLHQREYPIILPNTPRGTLAPSDYSDSSKWQIRYPCSSSAQSPQNTAGRRDS